MVTLKKNITVLDIIDVIGDNINVYVQDVCTKKLITYYDGRNSIDTELLVYPVEHIYTNDSGDIVLEVMYDFANYDELNAEAKLNCLTTYVYNICAYEHFDDLKNIAELEDCVREFWKMSEYTLDKNGNWYDEDFQKI